MLDRSGPGHGLVGDRLEADDVAAAIAAVGRDEQPCLRVVDAIAQRLGAEAAEHDAVHGADARAREHRDRQLGHERHVDRDAVALPRAERLQDVGERGDLPMEIEVRQRPSIAGLAFPDDRGLVAARSAHVTVEAVDAGVQLAADEPLRVRRLPVEHGRPRTRPLELAGQARPECFGISRRLRIDALVGRDSLVLECLGRSEGAAFPEEVVELGMLRVGHAGILLHPCRTVSRSARQAARGPSRRDRCG